MIDAQVIAFIVVAALLTITPGADTMLVFRNVLQGGYQQGIITTFGICSGLFVHALLSALGVSMVLMHSAELFHTVKLIGAIYLIWLGWQSLSGLAKNDRMDRMETSQSMGKSSIACFIEGFLNNVLNPKVAVFYLAFLPQFIGPEDPVMAKSILLAGIHYVMGIIWLVGLSGVVHWARIFITRSSVRKWLDGICGMVLLGIGLKLAFEKQ